MNAIITVVGSDQVGIIAKVSNKLATYEINVVDISQTILSGNFVMMMMVDVTNSKLPIANLREKMNELGDMLKVNINIINEKVFSTMHRL